MSLGERFARWWHRMRYHRRMERQQLVRLEVEAEEAYAHVRDITQRCKGANGESLEDLARAIEKTVEDGR